MWGRNHGKHYKQHTALQTLFKPTQHTHTHIENIYPTQHTHTYREYISNATHAYILRIYIQRNTRIHIENIYPTQHTHTYREYISNTTHTYILGISLPGPEAYLICRLRCRTQRWQALLSLKPCAPRAASAAPDNERGRQTRAEEGRGLMSHVTCHTPHVTRHTSHVTRHTSHVTCAPICARWAVAIES
jgi:hypothetical protein